MAETRLARAGELTVGAGPLLAGGPNPRWASSDGQTLRVWADAALERTVTLGGDDLATSLRFTADGRRLTAGASQVDLSTGAVTRPDALAAALGHGLPSGSDRHYRVEAAVWSPGGDLLVIGAAFRPAHRGKRLGELPSQRLLALSSGDGGVHDLGATAEYGGDWYLIAATSTHVAAINDPWRCGIGPPGRAAA